MSTPTDNQPATPQPRPAIGRPNNVSNMGQKLPAQPAQDSINSGMNCNQNSAVTPVTVKPVDSKAIAGSYAGDHRAQAHDAVMPKQPSPRQATSQARSSKFDADSPADAVGGSGSGESQEPLEGVGG